MDLQVATHDAKGSWALVYASQSYGVSLDMGRLVGDSALGRPFDPRTRQYEDTGRYAAEAEREFDPAGEPGRGSDWLLVLDTSMG